MAVWIEHRGQEEPRNLPSSSGFSWRSEAFRISLPEILIQGAKSSRRFAPKANTAACWVSADTGLLLRSLHAALGIFFFITSRGSGDPEKSSERNASRLVVACFCKAWISLSCPESSFSFLSSWSLLNVVQRSRYFAENVGLASNIGIELSHLVQRESVRNIGDPFDYVIEVGDELHDVFAVERCDEGVVQTSQGVSITCAASTLALPI